MISHNFDPVRDAQIHARMQALYSEPVASRPGGEARPGSAGPMRRARRSVGRALVALGTQVAGAPSESMSGGRQAA